MARALGQTFRRGGYGWRRGTRLLRGRRPRERSGGRPRPSAPPGLRAAISMTRSPWAARISRSSSRRKASTRSILLTTAQSPGPEEGQFAVLFHVEHRRVDHPEPQVGASRPSPSSAHALGLDGASLSPQPGRISEQCLVAPEGQRNLDDVSASCPAWT